MAHINILFSDPKNGSKSYSFTLKDEDMYEIYKTHSISEGQDKALAGRDGAPNVFINDFTNGLAQKFVRELLSNYYYTKGNLLAEEVKKSITQIEVFEGN